MKYLDGNYSYNITGAKGIYSSWDVYHIQEGNERPTKADEEVIRQIFENQIMGTKHMATYALAARDF